MGPSASTAFSWAEDVLSPILFTLLLAWMLYIVLHTLISFKTNDLTVARDKSDDAAASSLPPEGVSRLVDSLVAASAEGGPPGEREGQRDELAPRGESAAGVAQEQAEEEDDDEEWEGVESSEVEEQFAAAAALMTSLAASGGVRVGEGLQLLLYALYKQAMEGPCRVARPAVLSFKARAKWDAWHKLGEMPAEEAMAQYVGLAQQLVPGAVAQAEGGSASSDGGGAGGGRSVSRPAAEAGEEGGSQAGSAHKSPHQLASAGDVAALQRLLQEQPALAQATDEEGRTPLHWAADRGHLAAVQSLLDCGADLNCKDQDGQTALHYAAVCEYEEVARLLLARGADPTIPDADGSTAVDLKPKTWTEGWPASA